MIYQFTHIMSSAVETSLERFLHSLRSVGMTTSVKMYIVLFLGNDMSVNTCHVERSRDIFKNLPSEINQEYRHISRRNT